VSRYERLLRLHHLRLNGWHREGLTWGLGVLAVLLTAADLVSPWGIVVIPVLAALVLKGHDLLAGRLAAGTPLVPGAARAAPDSNEPPVEATGGSGS
jgi:hypothetical protein